MADTAEDCSACPVCQLRDKLFGFMAVNANEESVAVVLDALAQVAGHALSQVEKPEQYNELFEMVTSQMTKVQAAFREARAAQKH